MVIKLSWLQREQHDTEESPSSTPIGNVQVYNTTTVDNCQKEINSELIYV